MELPCLPLCRDKDVKFWTYFKRREMQEIVPRLFLGPYSSASKNKWMLGYGFTDLLQ
uniref:Uncharacterized protein n=1 Tax=Monodelphis domestica TaxID=13616 RepID=A0A5F8HBP7_MONDO